MIVWKLWEERWWYRTVMGTLELASLGSRSILDLKSYVNDFLASLNTLVKR